MATGHTNRDDLVTMLNAFINYKKELTDNFILLQKAAEVCDVAMGSDDLSRRHIADLNESLKDLTKVILLADNAVAAMRQAIDDFDAVQ